jgi:hypothetical protein
VVCRVVAWSRGPGHRRVLWSDVVGQDRHGGQDVGRKDKGPTSSKKPVPVPTSRLSLPVEDVKPYASRAFKTGASADKSVEPSGAWEAKQSYHETRRNTQARRTGLHSPSRPVEFRAELRVGSMIAGWIVQTCYPAYLNRSTGLLRVRVYKQNRQ